MMTVGLSRTARVPRWAKQSVATAVLLGFLASPGVSTRMMSVACTFVHSVKVIKKFDDTIGLRNIIQFS